MAIEIASLVARIAFESERASQVISEAERVAQAVQGVGLSGEIAAQKLRISNAELANLANRAAESGAAVRKAQADFAAFGLSEEQVAEGAKKLATEIGGLINESIRLVEQQILLSDQIKTYADDLEIGEQKTVEQVNAEQKLAEVTRLLAANEKALAEAQAGGNKRMIEAIAAQKQLTAAREAGVKATKAENQGMERQIRETERVAAANKVAAASAGAGRGGSGGGGLSRSELTSFLSMLMTGRLNASILSQMLFRLAPALLKVGDGATAGARGLAMMAAKAAPLVVVLAAIGAAVGTVFAAFKILTGESGQLAQRASTLNPQLREVALNLKDIKSIGHIDLAAMLGDTGNKLAAFGFDRAAADDIANLGNKLQFLNTVPGDIDQTMSALTQLTTRLDPSGLIEYGVNIQKITTLIREMESQGFTPGTIAAAAYNEVQRQVAARAGEIADQSAREGASFAQLKQDYQNLQQQLADQKLSAPLEEFVGHLRNFMPLITGAFTDIKVSIVEAANEILGWVEVNREWFQKTLGFLGFIKEGFMGLIDILQVVTAGFMAVGAAASGNLASAAVHVADMKAQFDQIGQRNDRIELEFEISGFLHDIENGKDALDAFASRLANVGVEHDNLDLFIEAYEDLSTLAQVTPKEQMAINQTLIDQARIIGLDATEVSYLVTQNQKLTQGLRDEATAAREANAGLGQLPATYEEVRDQMKNFTTQGDQLIAGMQSLADAWRTMQDDLTPRNAMAALSQFNKVLDMVIFQGIESIEILKLRAQAAFAAGFITQAQLDQAIQGYEEVAAAVAPIAAEAEIVKDKLREAANNAGPAVTGLGTDIETAGNQAAVATGQIDFLATSITTAQANAARGLVFPISFTSMPFTMAGGAPVGGGVGGGIKPPTGVVGNEAAQAAKAASSAASSAASATSNANKTILAAEALMATADAKAREPVTTPSKFWEGLAPLASPRSGGGGGGGGKSVEDEFAASLEQIRALMRAVNEAIAIGIRGGVRIGTEGNVVPFEPGTFLNAQGNQLTVDTIVIRGVWDFADPATRRQIVKELEQALRELKDEL